MRFPFPDGDYDRDSIVEIDGKRHLLAGHPDLIAWLEHWALTNVYRLDVRPDKVLVYAYETDLDGRNTGRRLTEPTGVVAR